MAAAFAAMQAFRRMMSGLLTRPATYPFRTARGTMRATRRARPPPFAERPVDLHQVACHAAIIARASRRNREATCPIEHRPT